MRKLRSEVARFLIAESDSNVSFNYEVDIDDDSLLYFLLRMNGQHLFGELVASYLSLGVKEVYYTVLDDATVSMMLVGRVLHVRVERCTGCELKRGRPCGCK